MPSEREKIDISFERPDNDKQSSTEMQCVSIWLMKKENRVAV